MAEPNLPDRRALNLQAAQQRDAYLNENAADVFEEDLLRPSVLDPGAPTRSYVAQESDVEGPMAGGGLMQTPAMELLRMQEQEARMQQTQQAFVGPPETSPTTSEKRRNADIVETAQQKREQLLDEQDEIADRLRGDVDRDRLGQKARDEAKQQLQKRLTKKMVSTGTRVTVEGTEAATSISLITLVTLVAQLNIQLINKNLFTDPKLKGVPLFDQSFAEDVLTIAIDILFVCGSICFNPCCFPFTLLIILLGIMSDPITIIRNAAGL